MYLDRLFAKGLTIMLEQPTPQMQALRPLGVHHIDMPLSADRVWSAIQTARRARPHDD